MRYYKKIFTTLIIVVLVVLSAVRPKTILVTGGGGYIGSHTILELLRNNYSVVVIDNLSNCYAADVTEKPESLKRIELLTKRNITFYNIDVRDIRGVDAILKRHNIDAVIHFAALKSVAESVGNPIDYYDNNVAGTNSLIKAMEKNHLRNIIYSSSATVYGTPQFLPYTEKHPTGINISNPYGKTKYFTEEIFKDMTNANSNWKIILLRYFNPVGADSSGLIGEDPSSVPNNLMPYITQVAVNRRDHLKVYGSDYETPDGTGVRDYLHITDLAIGHIAALAKLLQPDFHGWKSYNLGTGKGYSVLEVIKAFERASGKKIKVKIVDRRQGDLASFYADPTLAKDELKWQAKRNIDQMCQDAWNWQRRNPNGFRNNQTNI